MNEYFDTIQFIYIFIEGSPTRHGILENIIASWSFGYKCTTLKSLSTTTWYCMAEAVTSVKTTMHLFNYYN